MTNKEMSRLYDIQQVIIGRFIQRAMDFNKNIVEEIDGAVMDAMEDGVTERTTKILYDAVDDTLLAFYTGVKDNAQEMARMATRGRQYLNQGYVEQDLI